MTPPQNAVVRRELVRTGLVAVALLCAVAVVGSGPALAQEDSEESVELAGNGTTENPYVVTSVAEWNTINDDLDAHYVLGNDITASGFHHEDRPNKLQMIGGSHVGAENFAGTLDGQNHTIEVQEIGNLVHLFSVNNGTIRDLRVDPEEMEYIYLPHHHPASVVVAVNFGTVRNVTVTNITFEGEDTGGLVGENRGKIVNGEVRNVVFESQGPSGIASTNRNGSIIGSDVVNATFDAFTASGIVEHNYNGTIVDSNLVDSRIEGINNASGIVGHNHNGTIVGSSVINSTFGQDIETAGGIVTRDQNGTIRDVTVDGTIRGVNVGGVAGYANGTTLTNATVSGTIESQGRTFAERVETLTDRFTAGAGGVAGQATDAQIEQVRTTARIDGSTAGGIAGIANDTVVSEALVGGPINGTVTGGGIGLTGEDKQNELTAVYYDRNRTGQSHANGNGTAIGLPTGRMTGPDARTAMPELDFEETWIPTDGYPVFRTDGDGEFRETVRVRSVELTDRVLLHGNATKLALTVENLRSDQTVYRPDVVVGNRSLDTETAVLSSGERASLTMTVNATETGTVPVRVEGTRYGILSVVAEPMPALVAVDAPEIAVTGESRTVTATLENTAAVELNATVGYESPANQTRKSVAVGADGNRTVEFEFAAETVRRLNHTVMVHNTTRQVDTEIRTPPELRIESVDVPETPTEGEEFEIQVAVSNTGGLDATAPISVEAEDRELINETVTVVPGETTTVSATRTADSSGSLDIQVAISDDERSTTLRVEESSGAEGDESNGTDESGPGFGIGVAVAALLVSLVALQWSTD